jgi:hypothetical protein
MELCGCRSPCRDEEGVMPTVTVVAARAPTLSLSEMELLVGGVIVLALLAWRVFSTLRQRARHESR